MPSEVRPPTMNDEAIFTLTLETFKDSWSTRSIPARVQGADYDRALGHKICNLMFEKCGRDLNEYKQAVDDFIMFSEEFVRLQLELDRTGHYLYSSFDEARREVYDNAAVMERRYLNGLFLSQAFWINHQKILAYFIEKFCKGNPPSGSILEVPSGTGIFITEFARHNPQWSAAGLDLSASSVAFSREIVRLNGNRDIAISKKNVFELDETARFDRIICGELLEHVERPEELLAKLKALLEQRGALFLTTAVWAANIDHIYLFKSAQEVRDMLSRFFTIESELVLNVMDDAGPEDEKTPINYACVLVQRS